MTANAGAEPTRDMFPEGTPGTDDLDLPIYQTHARKFRTMSDPTKGLAPKEYRRRIATKATTGGERNSPPRRSRVPVGRSATRLSASSQDTHRNVPLPLELIRTAG